MNKPAALALLALGAGFIAGFFWGGATRDALPGATETTFRDGVLTVRVDTLKALREGLGRFLGA